MITPQNLSPGKRRGLFAVAVLLILLGGVGIYLGSHNFGIRALGLVAIVASTYFVRLSRPGRSSDAPDAPLAPKVRRGPGRVLWTISLALLPLLGFSYFLLHEDAVHGGRAAWPADLFGAVILVCAIVWGILATKIRMRS